MLRQIVNISVWYSEVQKRGVIAIDTNLGILWKRAGFVDTYKLACAVYTHALKGNLEISPFLGRECWGYTATRVQ